VKAAEASAALRMPVCGLRHQRYQARRLPHCTGVCLCGTLHAGISASVTLVNDAGLASPSQSGTQPWPLQHGLLLWHQLRWCGAWEIRMAGEWGEALRMFPEHLCGVHSESQTPQLLNEQMRLESAAKKCPVRW